MLYNNGLLQKDIARILGVTPSAISQELKRNQNENNEYSASEANKKAKERRVIANQKFRVL